MSTTELYVTLGVGWALCYLFAWLYRREVRRHGYTGRALRHVRELLGRRSDPTTFV